jgi:hypothetical protein
MSGHELMPKQRQANLTKRILSEGHMTVRSLAEEFGVSLDTIRRDLKALDDAGMVIRSHGGAMTPFSVAKPDTRVDVRLKFKKEEKNAIARAAATLIPDGATILINGGTTTLQVGLALGNHTGLTIVTNNLRLPQALTTNCYQELYLLGGRVRPQMETTMGNIVLPYGDSTCAVSISADYSVIGVGGITTEGYVTSNLAEGEMIASMIHHSATTLIVADDTKFERNLFACIGPLGVADVLITNKEPPNNLLEALRDSGVKTIVAK